MTSLGPSCSLLTQPLSKRYSLLQLDFFKETAHFANQPNTLNTVREQRSINTNLTNKSLLFLASSKKRNNVKVWRTPSLAKKKKKKQHLHFNRRKTSAKQAAADCPSSGSKHKNHPGALTLTETSKPSPTWADFVNTFFACSWCLIRPWPWG